MSDNNKTSIWGSKEASSVKITDIDLSKHEMWARDETLVDLANSTLVSNSYLKAISEKLRANAQLPQQTANYHKTGNKLSRDIIRETKANQKGLKSVSSGLDIGLRSVQKTLKSGFNGLRRSISSASAEALIAEIAHMGSSMISGSLSGISKLPFMKAFGKFDKLIKIAGAGLAFIGTQTVLTTESFMKLSQSGHTFDGSMTDVIKQAEALKISFSDLSNYVTTYSDSSAAIGDKNIARSILMGKSIDQMINYYSNFNMNAEDYQSAFGSFMEQLNNTGDLLTKNFGNLTPAVTQYLTNLTKLSTITGQSVKELEQQQQAWAQEYQTKVLEKRLTPKQMALMTAATTNLPPWEKDMVTRLTLARLYNMPDPQDVVHEQMLHWAPQINDIANVLRNGQDNKQNLSAITSATNTLMTKSAQFVNNPYVNNLASLGILVGGMDNNPFVEQYKTTMASPSNELAPGFNANKAFNNARVTPNKETKAAENVANQTVGSLKQIQDSIQLTATTLGVKILPTLSTDIEKLGDVVSKVLNGLTNVVQQSGHDKNGLLGAIENHPIMAAVIGLSLLKAIKVGRAGSRLGYKLGLKLGKNGLRSVGRGLKGSRSFLSRLFGFGGEEAVGETAAVAGESAAAGGGLMEGGALATLLAPEIMIPALAVAGAGTGTYELWKHFHKKNKKIEKAEPIDLRKNNSQITKQKSILPLKNDNDQINSVNTTISNNTTIQNASEIKILNNAINQQVDLLKKIHNQLQKLTGITGDQMPKIAKNINNLNPNF